MSDFQTLSPTQLDIHAAYIRLWQELPASQIRVNRLCQATPIGRSTFYAYYDNMEDLRHEVENHLVEGLVITNKPLFSHQETLENVHLVQSTLAYIDTEKEAFKAFLIDQVNASFIQKWNQATMKQLSHLPQVQAANREMTLEVFAAGVVAAVTYYLKKPAGSVNMEELNQLVFKVLY